MSDISIAKQRAINAIFNAFSKTPELDSVISNLEHVLHTKDPFAIYVSTREDGEWIFNKETIISMIGGESNYNKLTNELSFSDKVLFILLKKIGPIIAIPLDLETINDLLDRLYELM